MFIYKQALKSYKFAGLLLLFHSCASGKSVRLIFICARSEARCHPLPHRHPATTHRHSVTLQGTNGRRKLRLVTLKMTKGSQTRHLLFQAQQHFYRVLKCLKRHYNLSLSILCCRRTRRLIKVAMQEPHDDMATILAVVCNGSLLCFLNITQQEL